MDKLSEKPLTWYDDVFGVFVSNTKPETQIKPDFEGFARAIVKEWPGTVGFDAAEIFDLARDYRLIREIKDGYDPDAHIDTEGICPEKGDPWYEYNS